MQTEVTFYSACMTKATACKIFKQPTISDQTLTAAQWYVHCDVSCKTFEIRQRC